MSSRLTRTLLKLYPRRIRNRYGDELLDLEDELRVQGKVSRTRLIRDMLTGALLIRPTRQRRASSPARSSSSLDSQWPHNHRGRGTDAPARASHPQVQLAAQSVTAIPYGSCFVVTGSVVLAGSLHGVHRQTSAEDAVATAACRPSSAGRASRERVALRTRMPPQDWSSWHGQ